MTHYCGQCNGPFNLLIFEIESQRVYSVLTAIFVLDEFLANSVRTILNFLYTGKVRVNYLIYIRIKKKY